MTAENHSPPARSLRRTQCTNFWVVYNCVLSEFWDRAHLWTTRGRPYKFATSGNRSALTLAGLVPSAGLSARPAHAAGGTLRQRGAFHAGCYAQGTLTQRALRQIPFSFWENVTCRKSKPDTAEWGKRSMAIFHYTVKIVGRSKGKSIISASAYLNGDVMKNEETGRISYYTSKKEVVYTSLLMCENAPQEWQNVPAENIRRFQKSVRYKRADNQNAALEKFKLTFQKQRLWNEVLRIEKSSDAQLGRSFEFSLPKEWSRQEQIDYTTEYIQKTFVDKGMCADWSIHDKGDGNPHVHLLVTMRPFNPDHSWGNKEIKDWEFVRDENGNIVVDESHPDWWQDKKNPDRHGIRIPVLDENGVQKVGTRNRKQWKRVLTDATGWNNPKNCELWRSEWANVCNAHLKTENHIDHRSYARQGKLEIPTIHEGADARKIDEKFQNGQTSSTSWKVEENQIIKRQNALLDKIQISFGKVSSALTQWKERLRDIRRKPGSHSHDGDNDKPDRGTAESYGRDGTGIAGTGQAAPVFSGAEPEFKKLKQRIIQAAKSFARYRRTALTDRATENQNRTVGKRESAMAGINAEAEQREQLIAETEQRITDLKQQIEKARDILVVHQWQVCLMHNLIRVWFSNSFLLPSSQCEAYSLHWYKHQCCFVRDYILQILFSSYLISLSFNQLFATKIRSISISSPCHFYFVLYCFI